MRTPKKSGFWKIHQNCGICQKPKKHKKKELDKLHKKEYAEEFDNFELWEWEDDHSFSYD